MQHLVTTKASGLNYSKPLLVAHGNFAELTQGRGGSQNDGQGGGAGMACDTVVPNDSGPANDGCG